MSITTPFRGHKAAVASCLAIATGALGLSACGASHPTSSPTSPTSKPTTTSTHVSAAEYAKVSAEPSMNNIVTTRTCHAGATKLTFWSWVPGINRPVNLFNATHPNICVDWVNMASEAEAGEYTKLLATFKADSGVPDDVQITQGHLADFILTKGILNLTPYGADSVKKDFVPWVWNIVSPFKNGDVYAIPQDSGPLGLMYNKVLFAKYHLSVPKTWAQYASEAAAVHAAHPGVYLSNIQQLPSTQLFWWQTGAYPVKWSGSTKLTLDYNQPGARKAASYWQKLWAAGDLANLSGNAETDALAKGDVLSVFAAGWYPDVFTTPGATKGDWVVTNLPQWTAGATDNVNDGGSTTAVTKDSTHPKQAAEFAIWLNSNQASWKMMVKPPISLFPTVHSMLTDSSFLAETDPLLTGSQPLYSVYAKIAATVNTKWEWSPIQEYTDTADTDDNDLVYAHKLTFVQLLSKLQSQAVAYAKSEGFSVSS